MRTFDHHHHRHPIRSDEVTIRFACHDDAPQLDRVAQLDTRQVPSGQLLVAEAADEIVAARSLATGEAVADPFRPTADVARMLAVCAGELGPSRPRRRLVRWLRPQYPQAEAS